MDHIENNTSNNSSIVACAFVAAETYLPSRCLAMWRYTEKVISYTSLYFLNKEIGLKRVQYQCKSDSNILRWLLDRHFSQVLRGLETAKSEGVGENIVKGHFSTSLGWDSVHIKYNGYNGVWQFTNFYLRFSSHFYGETLKILVWFVLPKLYMATFYSS